MHLPDSTNIILNDPEPDAEIDETGVIEVKEWEPKTGMKLGPRPTHRQLTSVERLQIGIWLVEGLSYSQIQKLSIDHGIPVITQAMISRYKMNRDLMTAARAVVVGEIEEVSFAYKPMRIRKLVELAKRIERKIEETDGMETETKTFGGGNTRTEIATTRFASQMVKEYRETLDQIRKETEGLLASERGGGTIVNIFQAMNSDDQIQLAHAMSMPLPEIKLIPMRDPDADIIEGETREI